MAYRETDRVRERKQEVREAILAAALRLIAKGGYAAAQMSAVARESGVSTGSVYRYFPSKAELFAEVFRLASQREVQHFAEAIAMEGSHSARLQTAIVSFAERALRGRRQAWALLAEPVDSAVDEERLKFRLAYARVLEKLLTDGIAAREFVPQDVTVTAAALVGALAEALTGPLSPASARNRSHASLIEPIVNFCLRAVASGAVVKPRILKAVG